MTTRRMHLLAEIVGVGALLVYLMGALGILPIIGTERITLTLVFAIGPVAIVGVLAIFELLRSSRSLFFVRVGSVFLIIAFALFNLMLVVQQMVRLQFQGFRQETSDPSQAAVLDAVAPVLRAEVPAYVPAGEMARGTASQLIPQCQTVAINVGSV